MANFEQTQPLGGKTRSWARGSGGRIGSAHSAQS